MRECKQCDVRSMFLLTKFWKLFSLGPHFYKKLLRKQESLMYHHQVLCKVWSQIDLWLKKLSHFQLSSQVKFVTFQTWLDLKFSGSSSFKLENLKLIMVKPDLTWTWNFKFKFKFSSFQGPCWTLYCRLLFGCWRAQGVKAIHPKYWDVYQRIFWFN